MFTHTFILGCQACTLTDWLIMVISESLNCVMCNDIDVQIPGSSGDYTDILSSDLIQDERKVQKNSTLFNLEVYRRRK